MHNDQNHPELRSLKLGHATEYQSEYDPQLLQSVPRRLSREELGIAEQQPFVGCDVWHAYELSWLNKKGKPVVALAQYIVDFNSPNIIESKSFKLYLNSFNQTHFSSHDHVVETMMRDLSDIAGTNVSVTLYKPSDSKSFSVTSLPGNCIDGIDINVSEFNLNPDLLTLDKRDSYVEETLHSHLLKSNCLITNQPDWASVVIDYKGVQIDKESLLRYLISFRQHNEFHEQCVERIFTDIKRRCSPNFLTVQALYTRRGGLDINPYRSSEPYQNIPIRRINRQ